MFDQIFREMREIRYRLDDIEKSFSNWNPRPLKISPSELFLLPDHLRKTYMTVASKGECNSIRVSDLTGRCRALESSYLNQLVRMGWLTKRRGLKTMYFRVVSAGILKETAMAEAKRAYGALLG
ncbi:MAG: hypothetical protein ABSD73_10530 [Candidatus Bathyarchaeia archaeon]